MTSFFSIGDNSFSTHGFPWIQGIEKGLEYSARCSECGVEARRPIGDLEVSLAERKGSKWPDALGCGARSLFIVSGRVIEAWRAEKLVDVPAGGRLSITGRVPKRLRHVRPPEYYWLDGERMLGAKMDLAASGFVDAGVCSTCGHHAFDVRKTYDRRSARVCPYVFVEGTWNGENLFTTDLSPATYFCTDRVMECARRHRHTNFRFIPIEAGGGTWSAGIDYLGKEWPPHHPLRPSEGKTVDEWVEQLRQPADRYEARVALLDLGEQAASAVPALTRLLHDDDEGLRRESALLFSALARLGVPVGSEGEAAARQHDEWFQKTLGRRADA